MKKNSNMKVSTVLMIAIKRNNNLGTFLSENVMLAQLLLNEIAYANASLYKWLHQFLNFENF